MQEFLTNNTVTCNLMSLTGYRTLVILNALMESPKSNDEINDCLLNDQYIKENFSSDTLRIYINSLRAIGCDITRANKLNKKKYELTNHPFTYNIPKSQLKALAKIYKSLYEKVSIQEVIAIEEFLNKISNSIKDEDCKDALNKMSFLKSVNIKIVNDLLIYCRKKNQISILYNSPKSGPKEIEIIADKLSFKSEKLYLWGNNITHKQYSFFAVDKILKICSIKLLNDKEEFPTTKVVYELKKAEYEPMLDEKILKKSKDKLTIEVNSKNEFNLIQRILHMGNDCKVISPESFKLKILTKLKAMEKSYEEI